MKAKIGIILIAVAFTACNSHEKEQMDKLKALNAQDSTLAAQSKNKDSLITSYVNAMGEIQDNLDSLKQKERILSMNSPESHNNPKGAVIEDIRAIDSAIIINNKKVTRLESRLRKIQGNDEKLKRMIDRLTKEIADKDAEIASLQARLSSNNDSITSLTTRLNDSIEQIRQTRAQINSMTAEMNTVYYVVGTMKQLKDKGAVTKKGGILGLGSATELSSEIKLSAFTKSDKTVLHDIALNGKFSKLITQHPAGSYKINQIDKKHESLVITQPENFWKESKYLVIETR